ncbi:hypothetical protein Patl1_22191 [Pistacia atlantica]|uniref:Uncharacterized protein n=1 Tax=Pistacia atlantica TaxID=434234 RepID=A0ACC1BHA8_9ROSI|nr:hypothetical protein Patl1_22191 [Pistacia atlantica]
MSGPKKRTFQIEASKHRVVVDPKYAEKTWKILEHAIHEIYNHNDSGLNMEELYRNSYNMVLHKFGEKLYSGLVTTMTFHLTEICKSIEAAQGGLFLEELNRKWADHNKALQMIRNIFMYMDRTFIPSTHKTPVHELGLNLWRDVVINSSKIQTRLQDTLLELVRRERSGEVINRGLMRNITKMLMDLGSAVYQDDFEKHFLEVSADFYRLESLEFIESCDCGEYLKKAERRLNEEIERVSHYLDVKSESKITNMAEREMIESHMQRVVHMENSGIVNMLADDKYEDLGRIYSLFRQVPNGLILIRDVMTSYIRDSGVSEEDVENVLDKVMMLFRYLQEKDIFEKYYEQHLAKRLFAGKQSDDAERSLIVKLKTECGYQFTSKLEGILTDMKTSQDTMQGDGKLLHGDDEWDNKLNMGVKNISMRRRCKAVDRKLKQETKMSVENPEEEKKSK